VRARLAPARAENAGFHAKPATQLMSLAIRFSRIDRPAHDAARTRPIGKAIAFGLRGQFLSHGEVLLKVRQSFGRPGLQIAIVSVASIGFEELYRLLM
jgi:hypothetical protein